MGVELGLPDFSVSIPTVLPRHLAFAPMEADSEVAEEACHVPMAEFAFDINKRSPLLEGAVPVAGMQHVVFNMLAEVHTSMSHWDAFWQQLKLMERLLKWEHRRRRYVWSCVTGTLFANREALFERFSATLYDKRWHEVVKFCGALRPLLPILKATWDSQKFASGCAPGDVDAGQSALKATADEGGAEFDPQMVTAVLKDKLFPLYLALLLELEVLPEKLSSWAEGCSCHDDVFVGRAFYARSQILHLHFGEQMPCPMAGKRAPELAAGNRPWRVLESRCNQSLGQRCNR